jgi:hypothetical protein
MEKGLKGGVLSIPQPSNVLSCSGTTLPGAQGLEDMQSLDLFSFTENSQAIVSSTGISLLAEPSHDAQLSLVAPHPESGQSS